MMYLRHADLESSNNDLREFIQNSLPKDSKAAKY